jgi:23S rRNA-/tRNA-specific pseudouridylate synthase
VVHNDASVSVAIKPQGMPVMGASPSLIRSDLLLPLLRLGEVRNGGAVAAAAGDDTRRPPPPTSAAEPCPFSHKRKRPLAESASSEGECDRDTLRDLTAVQAGQQQRAPPPALLLRKPRPAHRLDSGTGGLLLVAKTASAEAALKRDLAEGRARKTYRAVVLGRLRVVPPIEGGCPPKPSSRAGHGGGVDDDNDAAPYGVVDVPLSGKPSRTLYRPLEVVPSRFFGFVTVVELRPETGRRHQLRRHMQSLGHPILGDNRYCVVPAAKVSSFSSEAGDGHGVGDNETDLPLPTPTFRALPSDLTRPGGPYSRLCLWAVRIVVPHPDRPHEALDCSLPEPIRWLENVLRFERHQWKAREDGSDQSPVSKIET